MCLSNNENESSNNTSKKKACSTSRKKLWQLDSSLHCSVIGTCLSMEEIMRFHQKFKLDTDIAKTDYDLHRYFVHTVNNNNYQSKHISKYLDKKYQATVRQFSKVKSNEQLATVWDEAVTSGDIAAAYWALITSANISEPLNDRIYGEVHMLSHLSGSTTRVDIQQRNQLQQISQTLKQQLNESNLKIKNKTEETKQVTQLLSLQQKRMRSLEEKYKSVMARINQPNEEKNIKQLKIKLDEYESKFVLQQNRLNRLEENAHKWKNLAMQSGDQYFDLKKNHLQQKSELDVLEKTVQELLTSRTTSCSKQQECKNLCGQCILYVGGRNRQCANFRTVVEQQNGQFIHHDGGLHDGRLRLGSLLKQVDAVFCPLDCVSHEAAYKIKKYCKQHSKKLVWLPRSSLAAFMRGLNEFSNASYI